MIFLVGFAMIIVAIFLIAVVRAANLSGKKMSRFADMLRGEVAALTITILLSCGTMFAIEGIVEAKGALRGTELGGGLVAIIIVWIVAWRLSTPRISPRLAKI